LSSPTRRTHFAALSPCRFLLGALAFLLSACGQVGTGTLATPMAVATTAVPQAQVGVAYEAALQASGGTAPYTWEVVAGALPVGIALNSTTGVLSGTPAAVSAAVMVTFEVSDSSTPTQTNSISLPISVVAPQLRILTAALPAGTVGERYMMILSASGGTPAYSWSLTRGALPAGLSLDATTGVISGTPTGPAGASALTLAVTDSSSAHTSDSGNLTLTIAASSSTTPALKITTTALAVGQVGTPYSFMLAASGGTTPYSWRYTGAVIPGISLAPSGLFSGTPQQTLNAALTFTVTDSSKPAQTKSVTLNGLINPAVLRITTASLPAAQAGTAYSSALAASGGTAPYTWQLSGGTLPAGLSFSGGALSGTPTTASATSLTFIVTDSGKPAQSATTNLTLTIAAARLVVTSGSLPQGQVGTTYSAALAASGGTSPYSWQLTGGTLPAGLSLSRSGTLSGSPSTAASNASLTFKVTDSGNPAQSATVTLTLTILPAKLTITSTSLPTGQLGAAYSAALAASGGTLPYSWHLAGGTLPAGLSLAGTGAISGTPTAVASNTPLTFQVTDAGSPAQTATVTVSLTITPAKLVITTTALPAGQANVAYAASLAAGGGTVPYSWQLTGGAPPSGLSFASNGTLAGTPHASVSRLPLTFRVTDSGSPAQTSSVTLALTIAPATNITVSVSPARAALSVGQTLSVTATTNDSAGVTWSISPSGGSFSAATSLSGVSDVFTAPSAAGVYTVTATSVTSTSVMASFSVGVTDLGGIYTYHNDLARDGANTHEYALTTGNVNSTTFGKLFSCTVDGAIYAQPLWWASLKVGGSVRNVVFVATAHDSLFAFDADANPCKQLWQVSLIDTAHGGTGAEVTVPDGPTGNLVGVGDGDITPEVGVIGTPVIDPVNKILYVVSKSMNAAGTSFFQRLHAIDPMSGSERAGSPVTIAGTYPGTGDGGSTVAFSAQQENQRGGLTLANGNIYIAWGSHEDKTPYYGWVAAYTYNGSSFGQSAMFSTTPNAGWGGVWMGGGAPSVDSNGNLYLSTGNGTFDATNTTGFSNDYGDSFLQLSPALAVRTYFAPSDEVSDDANDKDQGSGGAALVLNLTGGSLQHLIIGGGKDGTLYVLNGDSMGGLGDSNSWQHFPLGHGLFATGAFWNNTYYIGGAGGPVSAFAFNSSTELFNTNAISSAPTTFNWPGATPSVSASGSGSSGIVWALNNSSYCTNQSKSCGPTVLHAYDATNLANELWNSSMVATDVAGNAVKFTVPTVANGRVYIGTRGNNTGGVYGSTSVSGELDVYGLKPQ
jgi:Putative Ig domain